MPVAARFFVVVHSGEDSEVQVAAENGPEEIDINFEMPTDYVGSSRASAILQFQARPSREPGDDFQVQFRINDHIVYRYGPSDERIVRCFHVVIGSSVLIPGTNTLKLRRLRGEAQLGVSSVVIWVQSNLETTSPARGKSATSKTARKRRTVRKQTQGRAKKGGSRRRAR